MDSHLEKLREFESRLDEYPFTLPIFKYEISDIVWHLLLAHEHQVCLDVAGATDLADVTSYADWWKKALKHALNWAYTVQPDGRDHAFTRSVSLPLLRESQELLKLAGHYQLIYCAFSLLSNPRGLSRVEACDKYDVRLSTSAQNMQFEYLSKRLSDLTFVQRSSRFSKRHDEATLFRQAVQEFLDSSSTDEDGAVTYPENIDRYRLVKALHEHESQDLLVFPSNWSFQGLPAGRISSILVTIRAIMLVHSLVNGTILSQNRNVLPSIVWIGKRSKLVRLVARIEQNVTRGEVDKVVDFLVYDRSKKKPDPATQPIFSMGHELVIPPRLILNSNLGRNVLSVLARDYSSEYDSLSGLFHESMVGELHSELSKRGFIARPNVRIPGRPDLGDIDVLAFHIGENRMFLIEVKSVLAPGEPTEELSRADMEEESVRYQIEPRLAFARSNTTLLLGLLRSNLGGSPVIHGILVMRGFCGASRENESEIPTIEGDLLLEQLKSPMSNEQLMSWVINREFMPQEGRDYRIIEMPIEFGPFTVTLDAAEPIEKGSLDRVDK